MTAKDLKIEVSCPPESETHQKVDSPTPEPEEKIQLTRKRTREDFEDTDSKDSEEETNGGESAEAKRLKAEKLVEVSKKLEETEKKPSETEKAIGEDDGEKHETTELPIKTSENLTSSKDKNAELEKPSEALDKPKFVFGATTPFGANAFSILDKKKNVFESKPVESLTSTSTSTSKSVFGSNSTFGNAFQAAASKKSIFEKTEESEKKSDDKDKPSEDTSSIEGTPSISSLTDIYKKVELEKKDIKSGEEDEVQVFNSRAKLYALDLTNVKQGWKERGIGTIHVNKSQQNNKSSRVIMRSIGLLKVILNTALVSGLEIQKGLPSSLSTEKFIRITSVEDGKPIQYAIKTSNTELRDSLFEEIEKLIPKSV